MFFLSHTLFSVCLSQAAMANEDRNKTCHLLVFVFPTASNPNPTRTCHSSACLVLSPVAPPTHTLPRRSRTNLLSRVSSDGLPGSLVDCSHTHTLPRLQEQTYSRDLFGSLVDCSSNTPPPSRRSRTQPSLFRVCSDDLFWFSHPLPLPHTPSLGVQEHTNLLSRVCSDEQQGAQEARQTVQDPVRSRLTLILGQRCAVRGKQAWQLVNRQQETSERERERVSLVRLKSRKKQKKKEVECM